VRSMTRILLVVAAVAVLPAAAACEKKVSVSIGSTPAASSASPTPATAGMKSYTNFDYGFGIRYPARLKKAAASSVAVSAGADAVFGVVFVDPATASGGATGRDLIKVSVYKLAQPIIGEHLPQFKAELEQALSEAQASDPSLQFTPLEPVIINGVPGYSSEMTMTVDGRTLDSITYFLVSGDYEYQLILQSTENKWSANRPDFEKAAQTFTVQ